MTLAAALLVIPDLIFNSMIRLVVNLGLGDSVPDWQEFISPRWVWDVVGQEGLRSAYHTLRNNPPDREILLLLRPALVALGLILLAALVLLAGGIVGVSGRKKRPVFVLSGTTVLLLIAAQISFSFFEKSVTAPDFNLLSVIDAGSLGSIVGAFLDPRIEQLKLSSAVLMLGLLAGLIALWNLAFLLTEDTESRGK
jgi:hypothetical protein